MQKEGSSGILTMRGLCVALATWTIALSFLAYESCNNFRNYQESKKSVPFSINSLEGNIGCIDNKKRITLVNKDGSIDYFKNPGNMRNYFDKKDLREIERKFGNYDCP